MKKYFYTAIIYIIASLGFNLAAQPTPFFRYQLDQSSCFLKTDYPTLQAATEQLVADLLGYTPCYSNCALEQATACTPKLLHPDISLSESNTEWCFDGIIEVAWQCQPATQDPGNEEDPEEDSGGYFVKISPNPFSDRLEITIEVENPRYPITLRIVDLDGRVYHKKEYRTNSHSLDIHLNLGEAPIGTYYAFLEIKGKVVDQATLKLVR